MIIQSKIVIVFYKIPLFYQISNICFINLTSPLRAKLGIALATTSIYQRVTSITNYQHRHHLLNHRRCPPPPTIITTATTTNTRTTKTNTSTSIPTRIPTRITNAYVLLLRAPAQQLSDPCTGWRVRVTKMGADFITKMEIENKCAAL